MMKKIILYSMLIALLVSCHNEPGGYSLEGTLSGELEEGTQVFLKKTNENNQPVDVDTARVENGKFTFNGTATSPELYYLFIDRLSGNIPVILEEGNIEVQAQIDSLAFAYIEGTPQNDLFAEFLENSRALSKKARSMNDDMRKATESRDTAVMNSLRVEYFELQDEAKNYELEYVKNHPDALISALILDKVLATKALSENEVLELYKSLSQEIKDSSAGKRLQERLESGKNTSIGSKAPNFSAPTPNGEQLALHDVLGKATIVDFWAAWCKPCRAENPNVVRIYNKYKDKGLSILGVSLDRRAEDWKQAIADDNLSWNHVSNVEYFDEIARLYNVDAIPATFVLDENGIIVAKNLRGPALEEKIEALLQ